MHVSDEEIIQRVQKGQRSEYMLLFDRYYPRVESYARRQMHNAEAARDVASETFLRAYRSVDNYRIEENLPYIGYLLLICRRLILTERARLRANPTCSLEDHPRDAECLPDSSPLPLAHLLEGERSRMLQDAMDCLSEDDREIIHLAFERDLSRRDIGAIMGKPSITAVTSHLYRAMQKLKVVVGKQGYFSGRDQAEQREGDGIR